MSPETPKEEFKCALCGNRFTVNEESCPKACPFSEHCNLVCCPNCGYSFPKDSKTVAFFRNLFSRKEKNER
jgi:hypothetical protein